VLKSTLILLAILALATTAYPSTVWSYNISTTGVGLTPCSSSGAGPGSASCLSPMSGTNNSADASVSLTDNSLQIMVDSAHAANAIAFASITHDDFYNVPVNGPISALLSLTCTNGGSVTTGHFSLGSTTVSPPVETIFQGASQGSGPCGIQYRLPTAPPPPDNYNFTVSLVATNNTVHLHTYIDATGNAVDERGGLTVQLTVNGFQDANGNPIAATLVPEPGTWATFGLAFLVGAVKKAKQKTPRA
jgi:hypothetical protein